MKPAKWSGNEQNIWVLKGNDHNQILYSHSNQKITLNLSEGLSHVRYIDPTTGQLTGNPKTLKGGGRVDLQLPTSENIIIWIN